MEDLANSHFLGSFVMLGHFWHDPLLKSLTHSYDKKY